MDIGNLFFSNNYRCVGLACHAWIMPYLYVWWKVC